MKFSTTTSLLSLLTLSLTLSLTTATATTTELSPVAHPLRLINRCRPATIQRDALCGCYTAGVFGLAERSFVRRCGALFRTGRRAMRRACNPFMSRTPRRRFQSRRLLRNLKFVAARCPLMLARAGVAVDLNAASRMLSNFEIRQNIDAILAIVNELVALLEPVPAVTTPPQRMLIVGDDDRKRVARLREYNGIRE